jgi:hypothetical protein
MIIPQDTRVPCSSCERRDLKLRECTACPARICTVCWELHVNFDCTSLKWAKPPKKKDKENED